MTRTVTVHLLVKSIAGPQLSLTRRAPYLAGIERHGIWQRSNSVATDSDGHSVALIVTVLVNVNLKIVNLN